MAIYISIQYQEFLNVYIWPIYEMLISTSTSGKSELGTYGNGGVLWSPEQEPH